MSSASREATEAAREAARRAAADPVRPAFHFRPAAGWMNDPNGTIWHRGRCHLFYQHNPYGDAWGDIHWGHAVSRDLVRWEHRPVALAPSREAGEGHCFTGSAWTRADGVPMLFYTSVAADPDARPNQQWAVHCDDDLSTFRKADANPVLDLGGHGGPPLRADWRDPFVFSEAGRTFLLLGAVLEDEGGEERSVPAVLLYEAGDEGLLDWRYRGLLHRGDPSEVAFFECPNLVRVGGEHLLVYSAYRPVEYLAGRFEPDGFDPGGEGEALFRPTGGGRLDHADDFYATGRVAGAPGDAPVVVGWVRGWSPGRGWNGVLGLPRLLSRGPRGELRQAPVPAAATLRRGEGAELGPTELGAGGDTRGEDGGPGGEGVDRLRLAGLVASCLEVRASLEPGDAARCGLRLVRASDSEPAATVRWCAGSDGGEARLEVEGRSWRVDRAPDRPPGAGIGEAESRVTTFPADLPPGGSLELRLFWDRSLLELFARDGRDVCTRVMASGGEPVAVEAFAEGGTARLRKLRGWEIEAIW